MMSWVLGACDRKSLMGSGCLRLFGALDVVVIELPGRTASFSRKFHNVQNNRTFYELARGQSLRRLIFVHDEWAKGL